MTWSREPAHTWPRWVSNKHTWDPITTIHTAGPTHTWSRWVSNSTPEIQSQQYTWPRWVSNSTPEIQSQQYTLQDQTTPGQGESPTAHLRSNHNNTHCRTRPHLVKVSLQQAYLQETERWVYQFLPMNASDTDGNIKVIKSLILLKRMQTHNPLQRSWLVGP